MECLIEHINYWNFFLQFINALKLGFKYSIFMTIAPPSCKENVGGFRLYNAFHKFLNDIGMSFAVFLRQGEVHIQDFFGSQYSSWEG